MRVERSATGDLEDQRRADDPRPLTTHLAEIVQRQDDKFDDRRRSLLPSRQVT